MILGQPWWYWFGLAVAVLVLLGPPVCALLEDHEDERTHEEWDRYQGGSRW